MNSKIYFILLLFLLLTTRYSAQIEKVIVETYYIADQLDATDTSAGKLEEGSVTYRVYVDLKPGNKLLKLYGDVNHALKFASTKPFFNNIDGETYGMDLKKGLYGDNTIALDTWLTLGQTTKTQGGKTYFGILKSDDSDGTFIGGPNNNAGLLTNTSTAIGIPLTLADGMDTMATLPGSWSTFGIKDFFTGLDSTMFGSLIPRSVFSSNNALIKNSGVGGVIPEKNHILIAQLTTKGELSFELNIEIEELVNNKPTIVKYVATDSVLLPDEKKSSFLKFPFPAPVCGCLDPNFFEYNPKLDCSDSIKCLTRIIFGCTDRMACNFDSTANYNIPTLCCYPGFCAGREINIVCPSINSDSFYFDAFPNPTENSLFLNLTTGEKKEIVYYIYNSFGTLMLSKNLGLTEALINYEIDLTNLENSFYLIRVKIGNEYVSKQFLKNKN
jgi:hypothetical protein